MTRLREALSYDDVLLVPRRTSLQSRRLAQVRTRLVRDLHLQIPLLSAPTPWCSGPTLVAELARLGGLGILHRMQTPEHQASDVTAVKACELEDASGSQATVDAKSRLAVGAAIGATGDYRRRAELLAEAEVDVLVIDVAHGHADYMCDAIVDIRRQLPHLPLIAGNVATGVGVRDLVAAGAEAIKVGIGPGGVCTTRRVTGCGVSQLTAVHDCAAEAATTGTPIIADGGIRHSGDITKGLAAGASAVMIGSLLAGTAESAAELVERDGRVVKVTTGFASLGMRVSLKLDEGTDPDLEDIEDYVPEGVDVTYEYRGPLRRVVRECVGGLQSGMSYCGVATLSELRTQCEFVRVTTAGVSEGAPHASAATPQVRLDYRDALRKRLTTRAKPREIVGDR